MRHAAPFSRTGHRAGLLAAAMVACGLAGCSVLPQRQAPHTLTSYRITLPAAPSTSGAAPVCPAVRVAIPTSTAGFGGPAMRYSTSADTVANFAFHRWAAPPARMLQPLLVHSLSDSGLFQAVLAADSPAAAPLQLDTQLVALLQRVTGTRSEVQLVVRASLSNLRTHRQLSAHRFVIDAPADAATAPAGVRATNAAVQRLRRQLTGWLAGLAHAGGCSAMP